MAGNSDGSLLAQVNAPFRDHLNASDLAAVLCDPEQAKAWPGHVSVFFGEVPSERRRDFFERHHLDSRKIDATRRAFQAWSGEILPEL